MSTKRYITSLSKLYTYYEEVAESFLHEKDVDSYFYYNIWDIALIDNRMVRVSKCSNKKILLSNYSSFASWKTSKDSVLKRMCQFH